jgi:hypothetical protein
MIRINLLKPLQAQRPMTLVEEPKGGRRVLVILVLLAVLGGGGYFALQKMGGGKPGAAPAVAAVEESQTPAPAAAKPKRITANAVEEIVRQVQSDLAAQSSPPEYPDLAPTQRIAYQHLAGRSLLRDLQAATPPDVGFARVIFTPPGEFYLHGLAASEGDLKRFHAALNALPGAEIRQSLARPVGGAKESWEFSFFGKVKYPTAEVARTANRVFPRNALDAGLKDFAGVAQELGVNLQAPRLQNSSTEGGIQRFLYRAEANCDYARLETLLEKLVENRSGVGLLRLALEARGDEKMVASLDLLVYAQ